MAVLDRTVAAIFVLIVAVGSWTKPFFTIFGVSEFEKTQVVDMILYLIRKIPLSFALGAPYFIGTPLALVLLRRFLPRVGNLVQYFVVIGGMCLSVATLPLLWIPHNEGRTVCNVMGEVLVSDFAVMFVWHAVLCLYNEYLPPWTIAMGPLFGMGYYLFMTDDRPHSLLGATAALYACIGSLYRGYGIADDMGDSVFRQSVGFGEWHGYEMYAAVSVVGGFVLICASCPVPKGWVEALETILYLLITNGNVAAGWLASQGVLRPRLCTPSQPFVWQSQNRAHQTSRA